MPAKKEKSIVNGFHHVAIKVKDFDATVRFYKDGLGLKERLAWGEGDGRAVMLDAGNDNCIEVFAGGPSVQCRPEGTRTGGKAAPAEGIIVHFALRAADCDAALNRAKAAGATVTMEPKTVEIAAKTGPHSVRIAFVRTPGGEVVEFFQDMA
jgi:glyoxylase I family protein